MIDLSQESRETIDMYGLNREEPPIKSNRGGIGNFGPFARHCLLARQMIERGVRVVNLIHASWDHQSNLEPELVHNSLMVDQPIAAGRLLHRRPASRRGIAPATMVGE